MRGRDSALGARAPHCRGLCVEGKLRPEPGRGGRGAAGRRRVGEGTAGRRRGFQGNGAAWATSRPRPGAEDSSGAGRATGTRPHPRLRPAEPKRSVTSRPRGAPWAGHPPLRARAELGSSEPALQARGGRQTGGRGVRGSKLRAGPGMAAYWATRAGPLWPGRAGAQARGPGTQAEVHPRGWGGGRDCTSPANSAAGRERPGKRPGERPGKRLAFPRTQDGVPAWRSHGRGALRLGTGRLRCHRPRPACPTAPRPPSLATPEAGAAGRPAGLGGVPHALPSAASLPRAASQRRGLHQKGPG